MVTINTDQPDDEPTQEELDAYELSQVLNQVAAQFDTLCAERLESQQEEFGALAFLENDVITMMLNTLADTANACKQQAVKLFLLQSRLEAEITPPTGTPPIGVQAFKGTKEGWKS